VAIRIVIIALSIFLCGIREAYSQERLKQLLFDDCEAAQTEFAKIPPEQQRPLLDFLARVVSLNTQSPSAPEAFAIIPGAQRSGDGSLITNPKGSELIPGSLWQSMDAKRELRGKRCALELFQIAGAVALDTTPALVQTYSEQPLSDEVAVGVEETVALIAERAHKQGLSPTQQQLEVILPHLIGARPLVAQNFIQEYLVLAAPHLIRFIADRPTSEAQVLSEFLHSVDPDGARGMRTFIDLLPTLSQGQVDALAAVLPLPTNNALSQFINEYIRLAVTSPYSSTFSVVVGKACTTLGGFKIDSATENELVQIPNILTPGALEPAASRCLLSSSTILARRLPPLLATGQSAAQQEYAISLLESAHRAFTAEQRVSVYARLKELSLSSSAELAVKALRALGLFPESRSESLAVALSTLKRAFELKDTVVKEELVRTSFDLLSVLKLGKESARFNPFILKALQLNIARASAITLSAQAQQVEPELIGLLGASHTHATQDAALQSLAVQSSLSKKAIPPLIESLRSPDFQPEAEQALSRIGTAVVPFIRRALPKANDSMRASLLSTLVLVDAATRAEMAELPVAFSATDCSLLAERPGVLCKLDRGLEPAPSGERPLTALLNRCLPSFSVQVFNTISACMPESVIASTEGTAAFFADAARSESAKPFFEILRTTRSNLVGRDRLVTELLKRSSPMAKELLVQNLSTMGDSSADTRAELRALASSADKGSHIYFSAIHTLAALVDTEFDWRSFLKRSIDEVGHGRNRTEVQSIVAVLPAEVVLSEVVPALDLEDPDKLVGACMIAASLGSRAIPTISKIWHLREKRAPSVRYAAILALLEINPLTPDISEYVERVLVNRFFPLATSLPIKWAQSAAVVDLHKSSFGTLRTLRLEQLLAMNR
jgi:hypothetical protein